MIKKIGLSVGFLVVVGALVLFLRPQLLSVVGVDMEGFNMKTRSGKMTEQETEYADGYNPDDFGEAFVSESDGIFPVDLEAEPQGIWETLLTLDFDVRYSKDVDDVVFEPKFTEAIKKLEGKMIELEGFIIPYDIAAKGVSDLEDDGQRFMFSAYPIANCFFCGGAGAESVAEVFPKKPIPYTKYRVKIKGRLELNTTDFLKLPYLLKDAEMIDTNL